MKNFALLAILSLVLFTACKKDDVMIQLEYTPTVLPDNANDLFEEIGAASSDTVWVYVQGGPTIKQYYVLEETLPDGSDKYPFITDDLRVYPFQVQHLNNDIRTFEDFTLEQAKVESTKNAKIVKDVVAHFEAQNKVVYIIGHSYGSFIIHEVLAKYGPIGRKMASLNGRLDMDQDVWEGFSKGEEWIFDANGENPMQNANADNSILEKNMRKIAAGLGFNRYTQQLSNVDLSDAIFLTAGLDDQVGDITVEATDFLEANSERYFFLEDLGHSDVFDPFIFEILHEYLIDEPIVFEGIATYGIFKVMSDETTVIMDGEIGDNTLSNFNEMIGQYPNIDLINMAEVPGSYNDDINLQVSLLVHNNDIATHLLDDGLIASGGVDFFLAGISRTIGSNTLIGVHSWGGTDDNGNLVKATDFPVGHEYHQPYIDYYIAVGFTQVEAEEFYYFTINASAPDDIHWMSQQEIEQYKITK